MAGLVEVGENRPHLEVAVFDHPGIVPKMQALEHGVHRIPPDVYHEVVVVTIPQHFPPWNRVIAVVEQDRFHAPVQVLGDVWQGRSKSLLDNITILTGR